MLKLRCLAACTMSFKRQWSHILFWLELNLNTCQQGCYTQLRGIDIDIEEIHPLEHSSDGGVCGTLVHLYVVYFVGHFASQMLIYFIV